MKRLIPLLALSAAALLAAACGSTETPTPTPTVPAPAGPTATPTIPPTSTPLPTLSVTDTPIPTPTPSVVREWSLLDIAVDGSTVTVELQVFAAIDVTVTLDGRPPDEMSTPAPVLGHVFKNVAPRLHTVEVKDVVGFTETRLVSVPVATTGAGLPAWLGGLISGMEDQPAANPRISLTRYKGQVVYHETAPCCDFFTNLYDADGVLIGHPFGGPQRTGRWNAARLLLGKQQRVPGVEGREGGGPRGHALGPGAHRRRRAAGGRELPSAGYTLTRDGVNVLVRVFNHRPTDESIACAEIYRTVEETIPLGSDYDPDTTYVVDVNGEVISFTGDEVTAP